MSDVDIARAEIELQMVGSLVDCAHALGLALGEAAQAERDRAAQIALVDAFNRSFLAVRMGIRLSLMLRAGLRSASSAASPQVTAEPPEREALEREPLEREPLERDPADSESLERERDRDYEPVSLPRFLATLGVVAARADARRDALPAHVRDTTLPTLQGLLRQFKAPPDGARAGGATPAPAVLADPPMVPAGRSRLLASTGAIGLPPLRPIAARRRESG